MIINFCLFAYSKSPRMKRATNLFIDINREEEICMSNACMHLDYLQHFFIQYILTEKKEIKERNKKKRAINVKLSLSKCNCRTQLMPIL